MSEASSRIFNGAPLNFRDIQVLYPDDPELANVRDMSEGRFNRQYFYPIILLPLTVKQYSFLRGFNDMIISEGKRMLSRATEIYLVGYRAADDIIKEMFQDVQSNVILHVVSLADSEEIMNRVLDWYPSKLKKGQIFSDGFRDFINKY